MNFRQRFVRLLEPIAIPHLALLIVIGQLAAFIGLKLGQIQIENLVLVPGLALAGEWWRVFTFVLVPPSSSFIWVIFAWYIFYFMGTALEGHWGALRFNAFLVLGWLLTVGAAFITPAALTTNYFFLAGVFLAFAYLAPNFELLIFFVLPVKMKWLALITWLGFAYYLAVGDTAIRLAVLATVVDFLLFFGRDIAMSLRARQRRSAFVARTAAAEESLPRNRCRICGKDSTTNPEMDFRYCSKCAGDQCYCPEHLANHEHVRAEDLEKTHKVW